MIEMLGVLAIIGVLSAGGVWGYTVAMENYNVNAIINELQSMTSKAQYIFSKIPQTSTRYNMEQMHQLGILSDKIFKAPKYGTYKKAYNSEFFFSLAEEGGRVEINAHMFVSQSMCIKLFTYNWKGSGSDNVIAYSVTYTEDSSGGWSSYIELPMSMDTAKLQCSKTTERNLTWLRWRIPVQGKSYLNSH